MIIPYEWIYLGLAILFALFIISTLLSGLKIVPQSTTMVIERLGKYNRTLSSGVNYIVPFFDHPKEIHWDRPATDEYLPHVNSCWIDLREQIYDYPKQSVITKDNVNIEIDALLYFQIMDPEKAVYEVANLTRAIEMLTQTTLRNVLGSLELDESLTSRDSINQRLCTILDEATDKWGVKVNRVEIKDITPPASIQEQMEKQMKAERERRATILLAEGEKQARILEAEGIREAAVNKAEGEKQATILNMEGKAEAIRTKAEAEAEAINRIKEALGSEVEYSKYLIATRYIETLSEMVSGKDNKVVYMPYEAAGVLSSLGGIKDLFKS